jgi:phosphoribosylformimino-5-aminoimidazole carboxamide ribotide isomerase
MTPATGMAKRAARVIPVLDVMGGQVVRAVGGRREMYAPVQSRLTESTDPAAVAAALLVAADVTELYVADIDALEGHRPRLGWVKELTGRGCNVMVDAGVRTAADAIPVVGAGATVVVGTETLTAVGELKAMVEAWEPRRVVLSVDLRNGRVVARDDVWGMDPAPADVVERALAVGVRRILVLELARVGTGIGPGTVELCGKLRQQFPEVELIAGGGVRNWSDVDHLGAVGVDGVLVASALHDGAMTTPRHV